MTKKIKLLGLSKAEGRVSFTFKKSIAFFEAFPAFLSALGLEKTASFYGFEDNQGLFSTLKEGNGLKDLSDMVENTRNDRYDMDIFFGADDIIVVIRTNADEQQSLLQMLKKIAEFPQQQSGEIGMKAFEGQAVKDLAEFYQYYVKHGIDESLKKMAREIEGKYLNASPLIPEDVDQALGMLVDFYAETGVMPPSKEKAKKILAMLEKYSE